MMADNETPTAGWENAIKRMKIGARLIYRVEDVDAFDPEVLQYSEVHPPVLHTERIRRNCSRTICKVEQ